MTSSASIAELRAVGVVLNRTPILRDVELTVDPGEILGVAGANGSGKTTLLRLLATLVRPTTGVMSVLSRQDVVTARPHIELIGHVPALYPELTLRENLSFVARLAGHDVGLVDQHLDTVGLRKAADRRADRSSLGMQRRIEFARALVRRPTLLLLDEAHAGLDAAAQELVQHVAAGVVHRGGAVVMVSHDPGRMAPLATRVVHVANGTILPGPPT